MITLGPIRYAKVLEDAGGPISRLETIHLKSGAGEKPMYQVNAYLSKGLHLSTKMSSVFHQADGCGTSHSRLVARHKAISEALERWALHHLYEFGKHAQSGMDMDSTSTGMAAFPGLLAVQSRKRARSEAIERHALAKWATGQACCCKIETGLKDVFGIQIQTPFNGCHVVITWKAFGSKQYAYGFSAAQTQSRAIGKARIEMDRMATALMQHKAPATRPSEGEFASIENPMERRILNFSTPQGNQQFLTHVDASAKTQSSLHRPEPVFDSQLKGPWDRYTTVWRVLYPMPRLIYSEDPTLFYW